MSNDSSSQPDAKGGNQAILLSRAQVEDEYGLRTNYLEKLAHLGVGPKFLKLGRRYVRYRRADIEQWLDDHRVSSTSEVPQSTDKAGSKSDV